MRRILFAVFLVVACATGAAAGSNDEPFSAYERGDYTRAAQLFRSNAERGNVAAQYQLGVMYTQGQGVPQDDQEAQKWYRKAAEEGYAAAQNKLGEMYVQGQLVPQDFIRAYMWYNVAAVASSGADSMVAIKLRDHVASQMTEAQIQKAQEMARRCQDTKFKECD